MVNIFYNYIWAILWEMNDLKSDVGYRSFTYSIWLWAGGPESWKEYIFSA